MAAAGNGYSRSAHFVEILKYKTNNGNIDKVPVATMEAIMAERRKHDSIQTEDIEITHLKQWMKDCNETRWLEHTPGILGAMTNRSLPSMNNMQITQAVSMFNLVLDTPCPNGVLFSYLAFKICQHMNIDLSFAYHVPTVNDWNIWWKEHCDEQGWRYIQ